LVNWLIGTNLYLVSHESYLVRKVKGRRQREAVISKYLYVPNCRFFLFLPFKYERNTRYDILTTNLIGQWVN